MTTHIQLVSIVLATYLFTGCTILQQPPAVVVKPDQLACPDAPEIVDGDLTTIGMLQTDGYIEKRTLIDYTRDRTLINERQIVGTKRAGALIALKTPRHITYIEIYAESMITEPMIDVATDKSLSGPDQFMPIKDRQVGKPIQPGETRRFRIGKKIRYLRIITDAIGDTKRTERTKVMKTNVTRIPLKGPRIREVKLYELPTGRE
jgi:hypothetical protein